MDNVLIEVSDRLATITLNRPERKNAINQPLVHDFTAALQQAEDDSSVDIILLRGAGDAFCAGDDLDELGEGTDQAATEPQSPEELQQVLDETIERLQNLSRLMMFGSKTVVCIVHGWAVGGGAAWPFNADHAIWGEQARIKLPEAIHGLYPSGGITALLPMYTSPHKAHDLLLAEGLSRRLKFRRLV